MVLEDLGSTNGTYCNGARVTRQALSEGDKILLGSTTILKFSYQDQLDEAFQRQMSESALRDGLTRAYNKRYFGERIESELQYALRHDTPLSLIFLDIDHFKRINDVHGHQAGDTCWSQLATLAMSHAAARTRSSRATAARSSPSSRAAWTPRTRAGAGRTLARRRRGAPVRLRRRADPGDDQRRRVVRARRWASRRRSISWRAPTRRCTRRSARGRNRVCVAQRRAGAGADASRRSRERGALRQRARAGGPGSRRAGC